MTAKKRMLGAILAGAFLPALAEGHAFDDGAPQDRPAPQAEVHVQSMFVQGAGAPMGTFRMQAGGKVLKNAPYSAEMVSERVQTLADGNQITSKSATMNYRDSAGRTRTEIRDSKGELRSVTIHDPAEGVTWLLRPQDKTAVKLGRSEFVPAPVRIDGEEIVIKRVTALDDSKDGVKPETRVQVGPILADVFIDPKWSANATTKDLGTRDFDGIKAQGKTSSYEIPAGVIGNSNPIVVSDEFWYAPDLHVTVYTKHSDPRFGETVFRLEHLKREEPQASLLTVPSDYTVKDARAKTAPDKAQ